jgi:beta-glucosidase
LKTAAEPAYPFGHGLGYTSWNLQRLTATTDTVAEGGSVIVTLDVTNTGTRAGKQVIQLYAS